MSNAGDIAYTCQYLLGVCSPNIPFPACASGVLGWFLAVKVVGLFLKHRIFLTHSAVSPPARVLIGGHSGHAGPKPEIKQSKLRPDDVFIRRHTPDLPRSAPRGLISNVPQNDHVIWKLKLRLHVVIRPGFAPTGQLRCSRPPARVPGLDQVLRAAHFCTVRPPRGRGRGAGSLRNGQGGDAKRSHSGMNSSRRAARGPSVSHSASAGRPDGPGFRCRRSTYTQIKPKNVGSRQLGPEVCRVGGRATARTSLRLKYQDGGDT